MRKAFIIAALLALALPTVSSYCEDYTDRDWDIYYTYQEYLIDCYDNPDVDAKQARDIAMDMAAKQLDMSISVVKDVVSRKPEELSGLREDVWNDISNIPDSVSEEERNKRLKEIDEKYGITERRREAIMSEWSVFYCENYLIPLFGTCTLKESDK